MEQIIQDINRECISLDDNEVKRNNQILELVVTTLVDQMCHLDKTFGRMFQRLFYGGSFYDGLRVGHPEEFDLDMLLCLPKLIDAELTISNIPGFVQIKLKSLDKLFRQREGVDFKNLNSLIDECGYIITSKVQTWIQSLIIKTLNTLNTKSGADYIITTSFGPFYARVHQGGPAFTLKIKDGATNGQQLKMDVDLVPCFVFQGRMWPAGGYRPNPVREKPDFFIVPKKPSSASNGVLGRYWRLSFQEQERAIIKDQRWLKPSIRLLKKFRDTQQHYIISSYFIKTMFLWEVFENKTDFHGGTLYSKFLMMLKKYADFIEREEIPYFWNKRNNLIASYRGNVILLNMKNRVRRIIQDIERNPERIRFYIDPFSGKL